MVERITQAVIGAVDTMMVFTREDQCLICMPEWVKHFETKENSKCHLFGSVSQGMTFFGVNFTTGLTQESRSPNAVIQCS